ncbi:hypothetical protein ACQ86N_30220 [Puia sp. P3]|uniref:hypothetical protein n=1 Tax=Puia sp. P3 TaxID=3423952 RepID=UPI003D665282
MIGLKEIEIQLLEIAGDESLRCESNFAGRSDALDLIDLLIPALSGGSGNGDDRALIDVLHFAEELRSELEGIDAGWFGKLREGVLRGEDLKELMCGFGGGDGVGYDVLDHFVNGWMADGGLPEAELAPEPEMVFYQKTPVRIVLELERLAGLGVDDVFVDLGSGLGQVVLLMGLLTGARCVGVEFEPAYHNYAEGCRRRLGVGTVRFVNADVRMTGFDEGTVFYLYTPFGGQMLEDVLGLLEREAQGRTIRIFTYGPCSPVVAGKGWLSCRSGDVGDIYRLCEFVSR